MLRVKTRAVRNREAVRISEDNWQFNRPRMTDRVDAD